jgi:RNA polymerase sigma-70 factor (ECF subfamily)
VVPEDALPWLLATARRVLANQRRATGRQAALHDRLPADRSAPDSGEPASDRVIDALGTLSEADQEVLLLSAWEDLEPVRAAKVLGIRKGTYAMRLSRARKRLAVVLDRQPLPNTRPSTEVLP